MDVLFFLIPLSLVLVAAIVGAVLWAVRTGQFDDLEGPAHRIVMDDDRPQPTGTGPDDAGETTTKQE